MTPVQLTGWLDRQEPIHQKLLDYILGRLSAELKELQPVAIDGRLKLDHSVLSKLHTGGFEGPDKVRDLIGIKVVVLYRRQLDEAIKIARSCGLQADFPEQPGVAPTDLRYRMPKVFLAPPADYIERNPDVAGLAAEVQFTTALQHALDMATHDFDYKGKTYLWGNFRLVAQLRGTLELVDSILDDVSTAAVLAESVPAKPRQYDVAEEVSVVLTSRFESDALPPDLRRMTDVVAAWCKSIEMSPADLGALLDRHTDLTGALSLDATSAVLGALLREDRDRLVTAFEARFYISSELESLCSEARAVPTARRVVQPT